MKKIFTLLVVVCLFVGVMKGQNFKAGLFAGAVPSQVDGDGMSGFHRIGFTGGLYAKYESNEKLFFQADIAYTTKGSKQKSSKDVDFSRLNVYTSYLDITLSCGYKLMDNLSARVGLVPAVLLSHKEQTMGGVDITDGYEFKPVNLLAMAEVSYAFSKHFALNISYNYSVISIRKGGMEVFDYNIKVHNAQYHNYLTLTLAYQF